MKVPGQEKKFALPEAGEVKARAVRSQSWKERGNLPGMRFQRGNDQERLQQGCRERKGRKEGETSSWKT